MLNVGNLIKTYNPLVTLTRFAGRYKVARKNKAPGGVMFGGIRYYPRTPNEIDPEIEPSKLFRVERIASYKKQPYWLKRILRDIGLYRGPNVTVVKNIPEINAMLWKVKHLIKVTPINFPYGEPTEADINNTVLKENGDCIVIKDIETLNNRLEAAQKFKSDPKILDGETLRRDSQLKWNTAWE